MKTLLTIISIVLVIAVVYSAALVSSQQQKECCLCNSLRCHAICLIDLQTGSMTELDLYLPHATKVAELAEEQPRQNTFSLIRLGNISGYKDTSQERIEMSVPTADREINPALCKKCRQLLQAGYIGRYVLADLYHKEDKKMIPIVNHIDLRIRCYTISITPEESGKLKVTIQGNLT